MQSIDTGSQVGRHFVTFLVLLKLITLMFSGLQPGLVKARQRAGLHPRLLSESDPGLEIPQPGPGDVFYLLHFLPLKYFLH